MFRDLLGLIVCLSLSLLIHAQADCPNTSVWTISQFQYFSAYNSTLTHSSIYFHFADASTPHQPYETDCWRDIAADPNHTGPSSIKEDVWINCWDSMVTSFKFSGDNDNFRIRHEFECRYA